MSRSSSSICGLCQYQKLGVGDNASNKAVVIYKTGNNIRKDWFAVLQPHTHSDPLTGFNIQLSPLDHLDSFASIYEHMDVAKNFGVAIAALDNAIARLRSEEHSSEDPYQHSQLVILKHQPGKAYEHLHVKMIVPKGPVAQPFPTEAGWQWKQEFTDSEFQPYIRGTPCAPVDLDHDRFHYLAKKLIKLIEQ